LGQVLGFVIVMNEYMWSDLNDGQQDIRLQAGSNMINHFARLMIDESDYIAGKLNDASFGKEVPVTRMAENERQKILDATLK